ncbi:MAG: DNA alkylation repair protein [Bacteroidales bacterium]|jgi:3-methyladenine DNA glycosylase AlkD|nr:DNA alkylation repair protein [Bacteroidales bacterium]
MDTILEQIRQELKNAASETNRNTSQRFFKEGEQANVYGVKMPEVSRIAKKGFQETKGRTKTEIFALCEELWQSGYLEETAVACYWSYALRKQYVPADFEAFERWVNNYVDNWASCDTLCNHTIGEFVEQFPEYVSRLKQWAKSSSRWTKRAAAVTLVIPARKGMFLNDILKIAETLLSDPDDLVQKGYGWMLKAASMSESFVKGSSETKKEHLETVFRFVMKHKTTMPRTALRYAIEKMPPEMKTEAMKK